MKICGIVAEYNPFHTGHAYQIAETRRLLGGCAVVCIMSGNWVQRGECAVFDKWSRAQAALEGGADLVLELPTVWAVSSAESFAQGAVGLLKAAGVVDVLSFGSECGAVEQLQRLAACLDSPAYERRLRDFLAQGLPFAVCRQRAAGSLLGEGTAKLLNQPNNNLGVEYLRALNACGSSIRPVTVLRQGAGHNGTTAGGYASASQLRTWIRSGEGDRAAVYLPAPISGEPADLAWCERAVLARLRSMSAEDWAARPDAGAAEGLPQRLEQAGRQSRSLAEFLERAKTKRYTHARLRRLVLWAFLGLTAADRPALPPYLRVLGFNVQGRQVLREMKKRAALPVLTKPAHVQRLDCAAQGLFAREAACTDLYGLCLPDVPPCGAEWLRGPAVRPETIRK